MTADPRVSVVIPVLDGRDVLGACLDGVAAQADAPPFEVLVVDNGSNDGTPELAARHAAVTKVLHEPARGPYPARNAGIAAARGAVVALTDADCVPQPRWLAAGTAAIDDGADLVGGAIVQMKSPRPTIWERYDRGTYLNQRRFVTEQGFAATANLFVRVDVLDRVGPFLPHLVVSGDLELCHRAADAGYRLVYCDEAAVAHRPRTTMRATWVLHRKLGIGFAELAAAGRRGPVWRDRALRVPFDVAFAEVNSDGPPLRRRQVLPAHVVAMAARWVGRLTGRGRIL